MDRECLIHTENLTKIYGNNKANNAALNNVSMDIFEGEFLVILGHSASGKSTLLNLISGMDRVSSGHIYFKGDDITKFSNHRLTTYRKENIAFVFQFFNLLYDITSVGNVLISPGSNKNMKDINKLFTDIGLKDKEFEFPKNLSGGQQQRVAIARALNKMSDIIVCDEPTGALDEDSGRAVLTLLENINQKENKTIVLVTHTAEIANMADRIIKLKNGKISETIINTNKIKASDIEY